MSAKISKFSEMLLFYLKKNSNVLSESTLNLKSKGLDFNTDSAVWP